MLQDNVTDIHTSLVTAFNDVLRAGNSTGDNVRACLKTHSTHAERFLDTILIIDDELLRQDMNHFPIHWYCQSFRCIDYAADIFVGNFPVFNSNHSLGVDSLDVATGNTGKDRLDLATGHQLGFLNRLANCIDRTFDIDDDTLTQPPRRAGTNTDDIKTLVCQCPDYGTDFRCTNIQADNQIFPLCVHVSPLPSLLLTPLDRLLDINFDNHAVGHIQVDIFESQQPWLKVFINCFKTIQLVVKILFSHMDRDTTDPGMNS